MHTRSQTAVRVLALPTALLAAWTAYTTVQYSVYFPPPQEIVAAALDWLPQGWSEDLAPSVRNLAVGFLAATVIGIVAGFIIGSVRWVYSLTMPLIDFLRSIPKPAIIPLFVLILGIGPQSRILIITLGALWPILIGTIDGIRGVEQRYLDVARVFRVTGLRRVLRVMLPAASPQILAGMKTGIGLAIVMVVVSEMIASANGLGYFILRSQRVFDLPYMWAGTIVLGLLGFLLSFGFERLERRLLKWKADR